MMNTVRLCEDEGQRHQNREHEQWEQSFAHWGTIDSRRDRTDHSFEWADQARIQERRLPESNRCTGFCRPVPNHSAKAPGGDMVLGSYASTSSRKATARPNASTRFASFSIVWPSSS